MLINITQYQFRGHLKNKCYCLLKKILQNGYAIVYVPYVIIQLNCPYDLEDKNQTPSPGVLESLTSHLSFFLTNLPLSTLGLSFKSMASCSQIATRRHTVHTEYAYRNLL